MKRLGKNERAIIEFLKEYPSQTANTYEFEELADNGAHFLKCIYPALKALNKRGIVACYLKQRDYMNSKDYWVKSEDGKNWEEVKENELPSLCKNNKRVSTVWQLNNKEV